MRRSAGEEEAGKFCHAGHVFVTRRAGRDAEGERFWAGPEKDGRAGEDADTFAVADGGGVAKTVIANGAQAAGENMAEVAGNKLPAGHRHGFEAFFVTVLPEKGDGVVGAGNDALITNDAAGDISAEITNGVGAGTGGLDVDAPTFGPDGGIDLPALGGEEAAEMVAESGLEQWQMDEVAWIADADDLALRVEARAGNEEVQMRMELHLLAPGVEDGGEPADGGEEPFCGGEFFGHGGGHGREKEIVELFGQRAEKAGTQFLRQREGHQEVGGIDLLLQAAFDPGRGGGLAAARAGFVIAAMEGKVIGSAPRAGKAGASHGRSAAMGDGPDGATLGAGESRRSLQKPRQETDQHLGDGGPAP